MKLFRRALPAALALGLIVPASAELVTSSTVPTAQAAIRQSGATTVLPQVVQPGFRPAAAGAARLAGTVRFRPARPGRPVVIQRRIGSGAWTRVTTQRQNRAGAVTFTGRARARGKWISYRGVAARWRGLRPVTSSAQSAAVWGIQFNDEFRGTTLGSQWADRATSSEGRRCARVGDPRMSSVAQGTLRLGVRLDPARRSQTCRAQHPNGSWYRVRYYLNGQVSTQHVPVDFTRGVFAARIKFPRNRGQHGSFWLQPTHPMRLPGQPQESGAEIDIVEFFGAGYPKGGLASFLYNYGVLDRSGDPVKIGGLWPKATTMLPGTDNWWKRYHVFSLEWTSNQYIFRVDGREHFRTRRGVSGIDEYLILSLLTSDWELAQAKRLGIRPGGTMHVDWTRVWQK